MSFFESLFLGIIQGITEFLPISSSAHLKLVQFFFNSSDIASYHFFDISCHLGTLASSIVFLRKEIIQIFKNERSKILLFFLAILPLFPFYFFLRPLRDFLSESRFLPFFLLLTAIFLFIASHFQIKEKPTLSYKRKIKDVLLIGIMQALTLIPGLSRSGCTISSAYLRGWKLQEAIKFSFLLAIPTILGAAILESSKYILKSGVTFKLPLSSYFTGFLTSFFIGFIAIRYIFSIKSNKKLKPFAWYLMVLAIFSFVYLNFIK